MSRPSHPQVFPSLFDWVSYPITLLIKMLYQQERNKPRNQELACPMCLELVACLERVLCFCHTGNTSVFATSLMDPLGLSRGAIKDGFPVLLNIFDKDLVTASREGFCIDANKWPIKGRHPAVASKRAQILNYSTKHYMVRNSPQLLLTVQSSHCTTYRGQHGCGAHSHLASHMMCPSIRGFWSHTHCAPRIDGTLYAAHSQCMCTAYRWYF